MMTKTGMLADITADVGFQIIAACLLGVAGLIIIAWIIMPLVIFSRLRKMQETLERICADTGAATDKLTAIQKHTSDTARFFNERDVKIE